MNIKLTDVQEFFFRGMLKGWASPDPQITNVFDMPHHKQIEVLEGPWRLLDRWSEPPGSDKSAGFKEISYQDVPVWIMTYGGSYMPEVIGLLKFALYDNYVEKIWCGGRGPEDLRQHGGIYKYCNRWRGSFGNFSGQEEILHILTREQRGYHVYGGMSLLRSE